MKKRSLLALAICLIVLLLGNLTISRAALADAGGWEWRFNLVNPEEKKSFLMPVALYIATDSKRFYVVESGRNSLHSFAFDGTFLNSFGPEGVLKEPFDMVRKADSGELFVVEKGRNTLTKINLKDKKVSPETLHYKGSVVYPDRIAMHDDKIYVLDKATGDIVSYSYDLTPIASYESKGQGFVDFVIKGSNLWAFDSRMRKVSRFSLEGKLEQQIELKGEELSFPVAIAIGPAGFIYILDKHKGSIAVFDNSGNYKYSFFEKGHSNYKLYFPEGIIFDSLGRLCVVDAGNGRIGIFSR